jgi:tetratricopeptide (TPR) repeat protein
MRVHRSIAAVALYVMLCPVGPFHQIVIKPAMAQNSVSSQSVADKTETGAAEWLLVKTDHFAVLSNTDPERAKLIAYKLEQFRYVFSLIAPELVAATPSLTRVRVFRDGSSYTANLNLADVSSAVAGYFQPGSDLITINDLFNISDNVSFHEYTHLLTRLDSTSYPLWFVEGIAQFYETFEISGRAAKIGEISSGRLHSMRINPFIPMRKLFSLSSYPQISRESSLDMFYAESWLLVHYLMMDGHGRRRPQLIEFLNQLRAGLPLESAFQTAFQMDIDALDKELINYLERSKFEVFTCEFDSEKIESDVEITSLSDRDKVSKLNEQSAQGLNITLHREEVKKEESNRQWTIMPNLIALREKLGVKVVPSTRPVNPSPNDPNMATRTREALVQFNEANKLYTAGQPEAALSKYEQALKLDPEFAPAYMHIGNIYSDQGSFEMAHLAYEKARSVAPNYAGTYLNFAVTQYQQGRSTEAEASFRIALSLYPSSAAAHLGLGNIYLERRQYARARVEYSRVVSLTRGNGTEALNAYIGLGAVYFYLGQHELAKAQYQQAIKIDPENSSWHRAFADNCRMLKQYELAEASYVRALRINPRDAKAQESLDWLRRYYEYQRKYNSKSNQVGLIERF